MTTLPASATTLKRLRVLFYAVNGVGLGHLTRLLAIARQLRKLYLDTELLFLTSSDADNLLSQDGIPYVHLPSKTVVGQSGSLTYRQLGRMYSAVVNSVFDTFRPNLLLVDTMVTGSFQDLLNVLRYGNTFNVFIHRVRKMEAYDTGMVQAQRFYDLVVAPHYQHAEIIPMPAGFEVPLFWSGPIMLLEKSQALDRQQVRGFFGLKENEKLVFVSLGGGGDASNRQTFGTLFSVLKRYENIRVLWAEGLLSEVSVLTEMLKNTGFPPEKVIRTREFPVAKFFKGVDWAVAAAGYNTFHELLYFGVPTLFVPKLRGYDDQLARACQAEKAGACLVCQEDDNFVINLTPLLDILQNESVREELSSSATGLIPHNHAAETARAILDAWQQRELINLADADSEALTNP
jgi:UDP-N-acetylglucosamine--N-acetylmuramyl-(pentapeptide) pyrophosphoryl-undecaprenol N-acetylglucosamine transferase